MLEQFRWANYEPPRVDKLQIFDSFEVFIWSNTGVKWSLQTEQIKIAKEGGQLTNSQNKEGEHIANSQAYIIYTHVLPGAFTNPNSYLNHTKLVKT